MEDFYKGLILGLGLGQKLPTMRKSPTEIPVTAIQATPSELTIRPGDKGFITFTLTPSNATVQKVDCRSSDIEVLAVNQFEDTGLVWEYTALNSGTVQIIVEAADGYGATTTVNVNVLGAIVFENCKMSKRQDTEADLFKQEGYLIFEYTPLEARGDNIRVNIHSPISGNDSPYTVEKTPFDNIKKIKTNFESSNVNDYLSTTSRQVLDWDTTDGTTFKGTNIQLNIGDNIRNTLFGYDDSLNLDNITINMRTGWSSAKLSLYRSQSIHNKQPSIEFIEGEQYIEVDSQLVIKAKAEGISKFTVTRVDGKIWTVTVNITDDYIRTSIPALDIVDEYGQQQYNSIDGWYTLANRKYRIVPEDEQLIESIEPLDSSALEVESDWITPKKPGRLGVKVTRSYYTSSGEQRNTRTEYITVFSQIIACGTVSSDYLKEGIAVWCKTYYGSGNVEQFNGINQNKVDIIVNANEASILETNMNIDDPGTTTTLTFNTDGLNGISAGRVSCHIYHFKKLITGQVTIRFQHHDFPDIYDEVTI